MFNGEDHAHFREPLEYEFYTVLLCHYRRIEPQPEDSDYDDENEDSAKNTSTLQCI